MYQAGGSKKYDSTNPKTGLDASTGKAGLSGRFVTNGLIKTGETTGQKHIQLHRLTE